jgi:hypothetical protein
MATHIPGAAHLVFDFSTFLTLDFFDFRLQTLDFFDLRLQTFFDLRLQTFLTSDFRLLTLLNSIV